MRRPRPSPLLRVSLRNLAMHRLRLVLTVLSVVLGTAFVTGSFVFTDTLHSSFEAIFAHTAEGVDVEVTSPQKTSSGVPIEDVDTISALPNVRAAVPQVSGQIVVIKADHKPVQTGGAPSVGSAYRPPEQQLGQRLTFVAGRPPASDGEVALNQGALARGGFHLGDEVSIVVPTHGVLTARLVGAYTIAVDTGGYIGAVFPLQQARELFTDGAHVQAVDVAGSGISPSTLRDEIASTLPHLKVRTGDQVRADTQGALDRALKFVNYFLLAFGAIALVVGTFIIYNTFSMIVAQRLRELGLLRAIGADRRQIIRSVLLEAAVIGAVGAALGLGAGVALAYGLRELLDAFHVGLPTGSLALEWRTVVLAIVVGVAVTVASALAPAQRAGRIPPVAALREVSITPVELLRRRTIVGTVLGVAGLAAIGAGAFVSRTSVAAVSIGCGAVALIVAVLLGAPALARPALGILGLVFARPFGAVGRLARTNAARNPRRTAATAFALTLGMMLVTTVAVFGASARASVDTLVDTGVRADFLLVGPNTAPLPVGVSDAARGVPGAGTVVSLHPAQVRIGDDTQVGAGVDGDLESVFAMDFVSGSARGAGTGMVISQHTSESRGWHQGQTVTLTGPDGQVVPVRVTGIYRDNQILGNWVLDSAAYRALTPSIGRVDLAVLVKAQPGTDLTALRHGLEKATDPFLIVQVQDRDQFKGQQANQINALLGLLYGLLALAIVIAILGIVNTLALSVVERRREIGILRAVGVQRAEIRRAIYLEAMLIAVFGAGVGIILGLIFGPVFVHALRSQGLGTVAIPWSQVVATVIASAAVGFVAALWPAARAARTSPLEAIAEE